MPVIVASGIDVNASAKSPVPVATSTTFFGFFCATIATNFRRQDLSIPIDITRFKAS